MGKSHLQNFSGLPAMQEPPPVANGAPRPEGSLAEARRPDPRTEGYRGEDPGSWRDPAFELPTPFYGFDEVKLCTMHGDKVGGEYRRWLNQQHPDPASLIESGERFLDDAIPWSKVEPLPHEPWTRAR